MKRLLSPTILVIAAVSAGCSNSESGASAAAPAYSRDEVRSWSKDHVVILVSRRNAVRLDNESVKPADLPARLAALGKSAPGRPVIVMLQEGGDERAVKFIREHAASAGLGAVEVR